MSKHALLFMVLGAFFVSAPPHAVHAQYYIKKSAEEKDDAKKAKPVPAKKTPYVVPDKEAELVKPAGPEAVLPRKNYAKEYGVCTPEDRLRQQKFTEQFDRINTLKAPPRHKKKDDDENEDDTNDKPEEAYSFFNDPANAEEMVLLIAKCGAIPEKVVEDGTATKQKKKSAAKN